MKKILYSLLTLVLGLVLSSSSCTTTIDPFDPSIYDEGVTINSVTWATRNVGAPGKFATKPDDPGMFYQFNRKVGWSATNPRTSSPSGRSWTYSPGTTAWSSANDPCPDGWRVPSWEELRRLTDTGVLLDTYSGVKGAYFGSPVLPLELRVFLPAAGCREDDGSLYEAGVGIIGAYWTSDQALYDDTYGYWLFIRSDGYNFSDGYEKVAGLSVRCVKI